MRIKQIIASITKTSMTSNFQDPCESLSSLPSPSDQESDDELMERVALRGTDGKDYGKGFRYRRLKAALVLSLSWGVVFTLYQVSWGSSFVVGFTALLSLQAVRLLTARPRPLPPALADAQCLTGPTITLVAAAKNEEAVIGALVEQLCNVDYPADRTEVWIVDDNSDDRTPAVLERLQGQYPQLNVFRRSAEIAKGGKSGALNAVLEKTAGEIIAVFDADAQVPPDLLRQVLPIFQASAQVGAVQTRKAILNSELNFWTRGQSVEMMLDSYFQQQRISYTGIGELRGNGQFIRRSALAQCGNFNEETITDDLDLTFRLHLNRWDVEFCLHPAVGEEGVTRFKDLWNQRNRWGEGGYQRYLDYWRWIAKNQMGPLKTIDVISFWFIQYLMPSVLIPDLLLALVKHRLPIFSPFSGLALTLTLTALWVGSKRVKAVTLAEQNAVSSVPVSNEQQFSRTFLGFIYMLHWLVIIGFVNLRMAILPKRLKWVKTIHYGLSD
jgi:1,2-diacylglycerol 3-beta-glucosyltransferase